MAEVMLAFRYRGTDSQGKRVQGQIDAASKEEAVRRLRQSAILPIDVSSGAAAAPAGAVKRTGKTRRQSPVRLASLRCCSTPGSRSNGR